MAASRQALSAMLPSLSDKFKSADSDLRVMALLDLNKELTRIVAGIASLPKIGTTRAPEYYAAEAAEKVLTGQVLELLYDPNSEVKNAAVACLSNMATSARPTYILQIVNTIADGIGLPDAKVDEENRDISCLALKAVTTGMSPEGETLDANLKRIVQCVGQNVTPATANPQLASELLQILTDVHQTFPTTVARSTYLQETSLAVFRDVFSKPRLSVRKRAVPALAAFLQVCPQHLSSLTNDLADGLARGGDTTKAWVAAVAGIAKGSSAAGVGKLISKGGLVETIMGQTDNIEDTDAVEGALTALEVLAYRCSSELASHVDRITKRALELVKYDPNYVDFDDDEDVEMDEDGDLDEFDEDDYSDDEDDSWKIRRSAAKLLTALISTRSDLLIYFYKTVAPVIVPRFAEREESVRLEVLIAFEAILTQTIESRTGDAASSRNKRKLSEVMDEDGADESPISYLHNIRPQVVKAVLKQTNAKTVNTRQQSFILLRHVVEALDGGLDNEADVICTAARSALRSSDSTTPSLTIAVLSFLNVFFAHHTARSYAAYLEDLAQVIVRCMRDKLQRVNFEAFATASSLAQSIRPVYSGRGSASPLRSGFDQPVRVLFDGTVGVLGDSSVDGDVREKALTTLGHILVHEGDSLQKKLSIALPLISARLTSENTAATAVEVIGNLAVSQMCAGPAFEAWLLEVVLDVVTYIHRNKRSASKTVEFTALENILERVGRGLPVDTANTVVVELNPFVDNPSALNAITHVLRSQPASRPAVDKHVLPAVMNEIKTSSNALSIESLTDFFGAYVDGDIDSVNHLVPALIANVKAGSIPDAALGGTLAYSTTAKCIGAAVLHGERNAAGVLAMFQRSLTSNKVSDAYLALLAIGEIGRFVDMCGNVALFEKVVGFFKHDSEEVRSAAAFAAGNMAVGSPDAYLPVLVQQLQSTKDEVLRLLFLYSLKEVILHSSPGQLDKFTDVLWTSLFDDKRVGGSKEDSTRNVKAACIGKLTIAAPARFLPQLQSMLSGSPQERALVAASIRYTFIDPSPAYTELIAPIVGDFLALMKDDDLVVRRLAVAALNAAAQNKPSLIADKLATLQPYLYKETEVKPELQRQVQMGPFKIIEDDGLENRKTAYETMYTLLAHSADRLDLPAFTERVLATLEDVNEVKVLGLMLLLRLGQVAPSSIVHRLDATVKPLEAVMKDVEVKEDTIRQDLERKAEMQRSTMRTVVPLQHLSTAVEAPTFHKFVSGLLKNEQWREYRDYQA